MPTSLEIINNLVAPIAEIRFNLPPGIPAQEAQSRRSTYTAAVAQALGVARRTLAGVSERTIRPPDGGGSPEEVVNGVLVRQNLGLVYEAIGDPSSPPQSEPADVWFLGKRTVRVLISDAIRRVQDDGSLTP